MFKIYYFQSQRSTDLPFVCSYLYEVDLAYHYQWADGNERCTSPREVRCTVPPHKAISDPNGMLFALPNRLALKMAWPPGVGAKMIAVADELVIS